MPLALVLRASSGFCDHILAVLLKLCKFSLYECKSVTGLETKTTCTQNGAANQLCSSGIGASNRVFS